jgi:hypothetical protein
MNSQLRLVDVTADNAETLACCGAKNRAHEGRRRKLCWTAAHLAKGLRAKVLLMPDGRQCGYIECLPGEFAWRGVKAKGYLFIHCLWTFYKKWQRLGVALEMIQACVDEAAAQGLAGVAVLAREGPWLASPAVFRKAGFRVVETAPPDYELLVLKLDEGAPDPAMAGGWEKRLKKYGEGLTIVRCDQCPQVARITGEIAACAETQFGLRPRVVELKSPREAQRAPTPYAVFAVIYNGRVVADHQISRTRFVNIMRKELG